MSKLTLHETQRCDDFVGDFNDGLAVFEYKGKYGYMSDTATLHIEPTFDDAQQFSEGLAAVHIKNQWMFLDADGNIAVKPRFLDRVSNFKNDLARIEKDSMWAYIDGQGQLIWLEAEF